MKFVIPCGVFARVAKAVLPTASDPYKFPAIKGVRIEHINGTAIAVATNRQVLVVEYIGQTNEPNGAINLSVDLLPACQARKDTDQNLIVAQTPGWSLATIGADYMHPANAELAGAFPEWEQLIPREKVTKSNGALGFDANFLAKVATYSPNGTIVLPNTYDVDKGIIVRDAYDDHWFAIFLSTDYNDQKFKAATLPDWYK